MKIISKPTVKKEPRPPSWWRTFGLPTGTVVEHNGVRWVLVELWSCGAPSGRDWERQ